MRIKTKRIVLLALMLLFCGDTFGQPARSNYAGIGYYGNTVTYPGVVLSGEKEFLYGEYAALPVRLELGFYSHPRYHTGIFSGIHAGFRRYFRSGFFLEESIGIGVLEPIINSDGVFEVDDQGQVQESNRFTAPDLMPSLTLGIGYAFDSDRFQKINTWLRPQVFWQYPHKNSSTFNAALQLGVSINIVRKPRLINPKF